ncbi:MAG: hypothetical protein C0433_16330 [Cyclobacterium sp.]|nr:hypothetical protein [Cyclobacterium sp.]
MLIYGLAVQEKLAVFLQVVVQIPPFFGHFDTGSLNKLSCRETKKALRNESEGFFGLNRSCVFYNST